MNFEIDPKNKINFVNENVDDLHKVCTAILDDNTYTIYDGVQNYIGKFNRETNEITLNIGNTDDEDIFKMFMTYIDALKRVI